MKKITLLFALFALIAVGAVWFLPKKEKMGPAVIHQINYSQIKVFDPVYVALDQGYFEKEGVTVNLKGETFGGPQALMAAAKGDVDAGISATTAIINAKASGIAVKGILDVQTAFADSPLMKWYVLEKSPIRSAHDLIGKKIGINTLGASFHYTVLEYLRQNGVSADQVEFVVIPHGNLEQALLARQVDVAGMIDPFNEIAVDRGGIRLLFTAYDVLGEKQFSLVFMSENKMQSDPEAVRRFSQAYRQGVAFIENNSEQASEIMAKIFSVEKQYFPKHLFQAGARVKIEDLSFWLDFMNKQEVKKIGILKPEDIGTNEFNVY